MWPIACRFHLENATASVRGTNALISYTPINQGLNSQSPFDPPYGESDPLVNSWSHLIDVIWGLEHNPKHEYDDEPLNFHEGFLENQLRPLLNETGAPYLTDLPLNTSANRFTAFADILNRLSVNAYSLILNAMQTTSPADANDAAWNPPRVLVQAQRTVPAGRLRVNVLQLVLGIVSVACIGVCMVLVLCGRPASVALPSGGTEFMSGGVLELVHLMHLSLLPRLTAGDINEAHYRDARRLRAENVTAEYVLTLLISFWLEIVALFRYTDGRLDAVGQKGDTGNDLPPTVRASSRITGIS
jgi:hypothetical protein